MKLYVTSGALADLETWAASNPKVLARIIRLVARELFPEQAPGKGRAWRFTKGQASKIRRHRRVKTAFSA